MGIALADLARVAEARGEAKIAREQYSEALAIFRTIIDPLQYLAILLDYGLFLVKQDQDRQAGCSALLEVAQGYATRHLAGESIARNAIRSLGCAADVGPETLRKTNKG